MKNKIKVLIGTLMVLSLAGCNGVSEHLKDGGFGGGWFSTGDAGGEGGETGFGESAGESGEGGETEEPGEEVQKPAAGQLTCSALNDNYYYDYWKGLASSTQEGKGVFQEWKEQFAFNTYNRLELNVVNASKASVKIKGTKVETQVDNFHKAYLFADEAKEEYEVEVTYIDASNNEQTVERTVKDGDTIDLEQTFVASNNLQIMFVIDATGSMGDEMTYIQSEIDDVIDKVQKDNANAHIELAMMVYRDEGDDYVTKYSDFTTNIESQRAFLAKQKAGGGGDFEEAVQTALKEAIVDKQWSTNATKLLFHVADAPAHDKDVQSWNDSVLKAAVKGIKIITVASSGIDKKTEYFFRSQSLLTAGQYVYLTNDSGIGGDHLEPTIKEPLPVEYLNSCLIRLINGYFTGEMGQPISYQQDQQ